MLAHTLIVVRGDVFHAHAWPLIDKTGAPVRDPAGLEVVAKIRAYPGAEHAAIPSTTLVMLTLPGRYGGAPVVAAQFNAMTREQTARWFDFTGHVWALSVDGDTVVGGLVETPWSVAR